MDMRYSLPFLFLFAPLVSLAANLPSGLAGTEIENIVQTIGFGSVTRLLRSAEAYPSWPGVKLGTEVALSGTKELSTYGDRNGGVPEMNVLPRLYLAKGLFRDLEVIFSTLPVGSPSGVA